MNFYISNSTIYFFPIFLFNYKNDFEFFSVFLLVMELILFIFSAIMTVKGCMVIHKTRVFHTNMNTCLCGFLMQWFLFMIGKMMITPYQKGWIQMAGNDPSKTLAYLYTSSISDMVVVDNLWHYPFLFIGMFLTTHYVFCSVSCLVLLTFERSCATYLLNDYETKKRPEISIFILVSQQITGIFVTCMVVTMIIPVEACLCLIIFVISSTFAGFVYIWFWNARAHRIMENSLRVASSRYSLQARFQAKENLRSLSFTKFVFSVAAFGISLEAILLMIHTPMRLGSLGVIVLYCIELVNAINPIIIVPLVLIKVPSWRKKFFGDFEILKMIQMKPAKASPEVTFLKERSNSQHETEEYFKQLRKAWT